MASMDQKVYTIGAVIIGGSLIAAFLLKYVILPKLSDFWEENFPKPLYGPHARHDHDRNSEL
jgi:hypothetical protein